VTNLNFNEKESMPPMPTSPDHPEAPPPNIPIPGQPTAAGEKHTHEDKCPKCGKVFNSKKELKAHIETAHAQDTKK
jgi:hypothetical protein